MEQVRSVLQRLHESGFNLNPDKMIIGASEFQYLGHSLSSRGIMALPERIEAIKAYPRPTNLRTLRRFIGMTEFFARFIPDFSKRAAPLHALKRKEANFILAQEHQSTFESLKQALSEIPILQVPELKRSLF